MTPLPPHPPAPVAQVESELSVSVIPATPLLLPPSSTDMPPTARPVSALPWP